METTTFAALALTLRVALVATLTVLVPATLLAYALARHDFPGKSIISALSTLPLVLPPTAVGYLLLEVLADRGILGEKTLGFDLDLLLTWKAAAIASSVMAFPLVVRTARTTFMGINPRLEAVARTLGFSRLQAFVRITLPLGARGLLGAALLGFLRATGEFGATVIVAGNIPGRTQTLASAIYSAEQSGHDAEARALLWIAVTVGFTVVLIVEFLAASPRAQRKATAAERVSRGPTERAP